MPLKLCFLEIRILQGPSVNLTVSSPKVSFYNTILLRTNSLAGGLAVLLTVEAASHKRLPTTFVLFMSLTASLYVSDSHLMRSSFQRRLESICCLLKPWILACAGMTV